MKTIHNTPPAAAPIEPPPILVDDAPSPKPPRKEIAATLSPEDEKLRAALPFTPAIAMDPIDGSKISIRATTPTFEHKGRIYYFSSEANRRTFMANPEAVLKGGYMRL